MSCAGDGGPTLLHSRSTASASIPAQEGTRKGEDLGGAGGDAFAAAWDAAPAGGGVRGAALDVEGGGLDAARGAVALLEVFFGWGVCVLVDGRFLGFKNPKSPISFTPCSVVSDLISSVLHSGENCNIFPEFAPLSALFCLAWVDR